MTAQYRLCFKDIFPEENAMATLEYLKSVSKDSLLNIIGFSNKKPEPNFFNFFQNSQIQNEINQRVKTFVLNNPKFIFLGVTSREAGIRLTEIILSNKSILFSNGSCNVDLEELSLFKSFLIINEELNSKEQEIISHSEFDLFIDRLISLKFPTADIGIYEDSLEFMKLIYSTIVRFEFLIEFIKSDSKYTYLEVALCSYFQLEDIEKVVYEVKYLLGLVLVMQKQNNFNIIIEENKPFLDALSTDTIDEDSDYTNLRNFPLFKKDDNIYTIIDYYFLIDKFTKSIRFIIKEAYNKEFKLKPNSRDFLTFLTRTFRKNL